MVFYVRLIRAPCRTPWRKSVRIVPRRLGQARKVRYLLARLAQSGVPAPIRRRTDTSRHRWRSESASTRGSLHLGVFLAGNQVETQPIFRFDGKIAVPVAALTGYSGDHLCRRALPFSVFHRFA